MNSKLNKYLNDTAPFYRHGDLNITYQDLIDLANSDDSTVYMSGRFIHKEEPILVDKQSFIAGIKLHKCLTEVIVYSLNAKTEAEPQVAYLIDTKRFIKKEGDIGIYV